MKETGHNEEQIIVDLYRAARRHVVRIDVQSLEALARLIDLLRAMSEGTAHEVPLSILDGIIFTPAVTDVCLKLTESRKEPSRSVRLLAETAVGTVIEWTRQSEGWLESAEPLDGLNQGPGHQYLSRGSSDDAEIEVSFQEAGAEKSPIR